MELNKKELKFIEEFEGLCYHAAKFDHLLDTCMLRLREECKDIAEFKRRLLGVETDREVAEYGSIFHAYARWVGYKQYFEIEDED